MAAGIVAEGQKGSAQGEPMTIHRLLQEIPQYASFDQVLYSQKYLSIICPFI